MTVHHSPPGIASWTPDQVAAVIEVIHHLLDRNNDPLFELFNEIGWRYGRDIEQSRIERRRQLSLWPDRS